MSDQSEKNDKVYDPSLTTSIPLVNPTDPSEPVETLEVSKQSLYLLGSLLGINDQAVLLQTVMQVADAVSDVILTQGLFQDLTRTDRQSGETKVSRHITVNGWAVLNTFLGLTWKEDGAAYGNWGETDGWEASVSLVRARDGLVIARASAMCTRNEGFWKGQPEFARRSMAITRACGRVTRLNFGWILKMKGYEILSIEETTAEMQVESERIKMARDPKPAESASTTPPPVDPTAEQKRVRKALIEYGKTQYGLEKPVVIETMQTVFPGLPPEHLVDANLEYLKAGLDAAQLKQGVPTKEEIEAAFAKRLQASA